jgi:hypothetical protein
VLHPNDVAVLKAAKADSTLALWDHYGYPATKAVQALAHTLKRDEDKIYYTLKFLKSVNAFDPSFDPRKPLKAGGVFSLLDCMTNRKNAEPIAIPLIRKTEAHQIVDRAVTEYVARSAGDANHFTKAQLFDIVAPLIRAMRDLAPMFPSNERFDSMNRVNAGIAHLHKIADSNQGEFSYAQLQLVAGGIIKDLHAMETALEKHLPELPPAEQPAQSKSLHLRVLKSSEIQPELIQWLWKDRIPLGKLTLFSGNPDVGKSLVSLDVAARLSCGKDFPDGKNTLGACDVLILAAEDDPADTVVPRLTAAGANLDRIHFLTGTAAEDYERGFALDSDVQLLREHLSQNPEIRLVIIDPISNYLGAAEINKEQELRRVLTPLVNVARDTGCAVVTIAHFNKQIGADAIHKTGGAVGLVGIQRMAWAFTKSPDDPDLRLMLRIKGNISANAKGLSYRTSGKQIQIAGTPAVLPVVEWLGESAETADGVLAVSANPEERSARQVAGWLREFLPVRSLGKKLARDVFQMAESKGYSAATVRRACQTLKVEKWQEQGPHGNCWYWALPDESAGVAPQPSDEADDGLF